MNPEYYPEFKYNSKGFLSDLLFEKKEKEKIGSKLDAVLEKYNRFKNPYFINYFFLSEKNEFKDVTHPITFNNLMLFEQVLLNLGFDELQEYPGLLEKLIKSTEFSFKYDNFIKRTVHHIKSTLEESLHSWIEEKGDLFRYELPLFIHYIYDQILFTDSYLYTTNFNSNAKNKEENYALINHPYVLEMCEGIYFKIRVKQFQHTLEIFSPDEFLTIYTIDNMNGYEFESFLVDLFRKRGCEVKNTPKGKDQGADLFIESFGKKIVIQVKNYQGNIGNKAVQEVIAAKEFYSCSDGMVITNRYFTSSAKELALRANIKLIDRDELQIYLDDYNATIIESNLESQET